MPRVLVTGATGFIGSNLTKRLVSLGHDVTCLVRDRSKAAELEALGVRLTFGDLRDEGAVREAVGDAEIIYHLAGLVSAFRPAELMDVNATAFRHLIAACVARENPPTLVSVSSLAAAGPSPPNRPLTESDPAAPVSDYGRAKRAAELIAEEYAAHVPITIVRPPIVFGEGDLYMRAVFRTIRRLGIHLALGVTKLRYSLIHVEDLVEALILCAERGARLVPVNGSPASSARGYYFVAGDEQPTFAELGRLIGHSLGLTRVFVWGSSWGGLLWPAAATAELAARLRGRPFIFNFDKAREARAGSWTCSSQTIRTELGFSPRASLPERLQQTADWYLQHQML